MKQKSDRGSKTALTLLFAGIVFVILIAVALVISGLIVVLEKTGAMSELYEKVFENTTLLAIFLAIISLIVGAGITLVLSRVMTLPMAKITEAMQQIASGNYHTRLEMKPPLSRHPTVRMFVDNFNTMAEELERTEILRSDFINGFSHEFKTPIVSIAGFAKLLKRKNLTDAQRAEYIDIIEEESLRLSEMATNTLTLTRIENQVILTDVKPFNLSEQIRGCVLLLEKKWQAKGVEWDLGFDEVTVAGNEEFLKQVWINLLDNAIKFCDMGGAISVGIEQKGQGALVFVSNPGPQIAEDERERIFHKFYQTDTARAIEGTGIGLAIVKAIVDLHGGTVSVRCENGITTFTVELP